jgi:hypothetical protein
MKFCTTSRFGWRCAIAVVVLTVGVSQPTRADHVKATLRADPNPIFEGQPTSFILDLDVNPSESVLRKGALFGLFRQSGGPFDTQPTTMIKALGADSTGSASLAFGPFIYAQDGVFGARVLGGGVATKKVGNKTKSFLYGVDVRTSVTVNNVAPSLDISSLTWAPYLTLNDAFEFSAAASDPSAYDRLTYEWDFNYDGTFNAEKRGDSTQHAYAAMGSHVGAVRVFDGKDYSQVTTFHVDVASPLVLTPVPSAVFGGMTLLGTLGVVKLWRHRRAV